MSIKISNLTKKYGSQNAVDNISLRINTGEIVGFIGPNGAGKSTTMKVLTGYIDKFQGEVKINGLDVRDHGIEVKNLTGYLPEHNPLYSDLYIKEYLNFVADLYKVENKKQRVEEVIELTGLTPEQHKKIMALSKGYRQRVGLAAAIIHDPKVLILDEPTTGLDPNQIVEIRNLIASLGKDKTVMLSTHIMQEVEAICDKVIIINKGKIVIDDKASEVRTYSEDKLKTIYIEFENAIDIQLLDNIGGVANVKEVEARKYILQAETDIRKEIFNMAVANNQVILTITLQQKSLEELFRELTKH